MAGRQSVSPPNKKQKTAASNRPNRQNHKSTEETASRVEADNGISSKLDAILSQLSKLELLDDLQRDMTEVKQSLEFCHQDVLQLKSENEQLRSKVRDLEKVVADQDAIIKSDHELLLDQQWRSMRDNLIFYGVEESENENTEDLIKGFCEKDLKLPKTTVDSFKFARTHRLGRRKNEQKKPRPIVAKFEFFKDRELVRSVAKNLAGSSLGLNEQVPEEWAARRREKLPELRAAKANGKQAFFVRDKLVIRENRDRVPMDSH
ncbi:uncharacterized protein LOC141911210 [Tubulanus polymorphus]|uniref:uncharacterized protein LOC141911210 n=1 Tax=Tubulanus polymorphus TaxID=672921 RepID=UPI003DA4A7A3